MFRINTCIVLILVSQINGILSAPATNNSIIQSRIKGGTDADINNAPFLVTIRVHDALELISGPSVVCGGSLISNNVVLAAAHCLTDEFEKYAQPEDFVVVIGNSDTEQADEHTLQFDVLYFEVPDNYTDDDIGLIFLDGSVPEDHPTAKPVILNSGPLEDGIICQAYGWGDLENGKSSTILQVVDLPLITLSTCVANTAHKPEDLRRGVICAGNLKKGGVGTCEGDSGGPLVCGGKLVGITSWGSRPCGQPDRPSVFTNVAKYQAWITIVVMLYDGTLPKFANA